MTMAAKVTTQIVDMTPEIAKDILLKHNNKNRTVKSRRVKDYAEQMKRGEWKLNGESIIFDETGELRDGQHRLMAVVESGCTVPMTVVKGVSKTCEIFDRGAGRSLRDIITLNYDEVWMRNGQIIAMTNMFLQLCNSMYTNDNKVIAFMTEYSETIVKTHEILLTNKLKYLYPYITSAVFIAIRNGVPEEKIRRWADVYRSGFMDNKTDSPAIIARNIAINRKSIARSKQSEKAELTEVIYRSICDFGKSTRTRAYKANGSVHVDAFIEELKEKGY